MTGVQIATIAMSVASIVISGLSIRWSVKSRRIQRELEARRTQAMARKAEAERRIQHEAERIRQRGDT